MIGISVYITKDDKNPLTIFTPTILIFLGVMIFGIFNSVRRQKSLFNSYKLTLSDSGIIREQHNTPKISILYSDINSINKNTNGSFIIKGRKSFDIIGIPSQVENYEQLENSLSKIRPVIYSSESSFKQKLTIPVSILTAILMATVYIATNKIIVGISGTLLSGFFIWSFVEIQRNKNIDKKTKRLSYVAIWVLIWIIIGTISKVMN